MKAGGVIPGPGDPDWVGSGLIKAWDATASVNIAGMYDCPVPGVRDEWGEDGHFIHSYTPCGLGANIYLAAFAPTVGFSDSGEC